MSALGLVYTALKTAIAADATTAALLASSPGAWAGVSGKAVYDDGGAPQGGTMPWITVGAGTEFPLNTFRSQGWNCTVQVKVTAQGTEAEGQAIVRALSALLFPEEPVYLTVDGFTSCWVDEFAQQPTLVTTLASVVTREWPVILRVFAT
jgi:hypothetical protein